MIEALREIFRERRCSMQIHIYAYVKGHAQVRAYEFARVNASSNNYNFIMRIKPAINKNEK